MRKRGLSLEQETLIGRCIPNNRPANTKPLHDYYYNAVAQLGGLEIRRFALNYPSTHKRFSFLEIASTNLQDYESVLGVRSTAHGEERYATLATAFAFSGIVKYAHARNVGILWYPATNEYGFSGFYRYNPSYYAEQKKRRKLFFGTNDGGILFDLGNHHLVDTVKGGREAAHKIKRIVTSQGENLCPEAKIHVNRLRKLHASGELNFSEQKVAFLDFHEDHIVDGEDETPADGLPGRGIYFTSCNPVSPFRPTMERINEFIPVLRNRWVDTGDGQRGRTNAIGQVVKHDGTLGYRFHLEGAELSATVDFREECETYEMMRAIGIFARGMIDYISH